MEDEEALDSRGRNITLIVFGAIVLLIAALVLNNYRVKLDRIAGMESTDPARQAAKAREMMQGFANEGHIAEQLQGERPSVRMAAVRALLALAQDANTDAQTRKDAAKLTVPFMKDTDQPVKDLAVQALTAMGPEIALAAVANALGDTDGSVKGGAQTVCQNFAPYSIPAILAFSGPGGGTAKLRNAHRGNSGNALHEISKRQIKPWNTVMLFGQEAVHARARHLSGEQVYTELQKYMESEKPLVGDPSAPIYGLVDYLQPGNATEEDQNNVISILDRIADLRAVPYLIARVDAPETRRAAVGALGRLADKRATGTLLRFLPTDETNRLEIVIALGRIADPASTASLIQNGLGSVSDTVRAAAADSLRNIGLPAKAQLIAAARGTAASDPAFYKAEGASRALAGLPAPDAVAVAVSLLKHPSSNVREAAAEALGDSNSSTVIQPLINSFLDRDGRVAGFAARSVSAFGVQAVPPLVAALADPKRVYWASLAIGYIGTPAVPALQAKVLAHGDPEGATAAATLLGRLGDPRAIATLKQALRQPVNPDFEFAASSALQRLSGESETGSLAVTGAIGAKQ